MAADKPNDDIDKVLEQLQAKPGGAAKPADGKTPPGKAAVPKAGGKDVEAVLAEMRASAPDASASPAPVPPNASMLVGEPINAGQSPAASAATTPIKRPPIAVADPASDIDAILAQLASKGSRQAVPAAKPLPGTSSKGSSAAATDAPK